MKKWFCPSAGLAGLLMTLLALGCGGGNSTAPPPPPPPPPSNISVSLSPSSPQTVDQGQTINITATVENDSSGKGVTWSVSGDGTLSNQTSTSVAYDVPSNILIPLSVTGTITAKSVSDPTKTASLAVTVNQSPTISTNYLPSGNAGTAYNLPLAESGGTPPLNWTVIAGSLPTGLVLNSSTGAITGTPLDGGTWYVEFQLTDAVGVSTTTAGFILGLTILETVPPGNPVPFVNQPLLPDAVSPGGAGFTLTVDGTGFVSGATVNFNGAPLSTTFVSGAQLTAQVPASNIASAGTGSITVVNPPPAGGSSNVVLLPVATPRATVNFVNATSSPIIGALASDPRSIAVADFNGDGKSDLVVANFGTSNVSIFLGNGDGTFSGAPSSAVVLQNPPYYNAYPPRPTWVTVGDFNNSGIPGLAVVDQQQNNVFIFFGNGDGTFTPSTASVDTQGVNPTTVAAADFTGDGDLDLAVSATELVNLAFMQGFGDGAFNFISGPPPETGSPASIAVGDFNGDGKLDLAFGDNSVTYELSSNVNILLGNGDVTFNQAPSSPITLSGLSEVGTNFSFAVAAGDFNGDGKLDLALTSAAGNCVIILASNGDGSFTQASGSPIPVGNQPSAIAVGDFNGDGKLDLAITNETDNTVTILLGNGDGTFAEAAGSPFPVGVGPTAIAVGDFDGSGRLGLAVANGTAGTISILLQK
jgi:hypothetical protein